MSRLRAAGILGMNERNRAFIHERNPRRLYPLVDDKLQTKRLCERAGLGIPQLLGAIRHPGELGVLRDVADAHAEFVLKPAHGAMGNGVLVVRGRESGRVRRFVQASGRPLDFEGLRFHALETLAGLYALGGQPDQVVVEECLSTHPELDRFSTGGVPDLRVLAYRGVPVMAMLRLPTRRSRGRANLHQGALGVGVDVATGRTTAATWRDRDANVHPDTGECVLGLEVPHFARAVEIAVRAADTTGLGYLGVDVVVDAERGPLVLELNARPGLAIQLANAAGLLPRLDAVDRKLVPGASPAERIALGATLCGESRA